MIGLGLMLDKEHTDKLTYIAEQLDQHPYFIIQQAIETMYNKLREDAQSSN